MQVIYLYYANNKYVYIITYIRGLYTTYRLWQLVGHSTQFLVQRSVACTVS